MLTGGRLPQRTTSLVLLLLVLLLLMWWPGEVDPPLAPADESELRSLVHVSVEVSGTTFLAAGVVTDSLETGVRRVIVPVVDTLELAIEVVADRALSLPRSPRLCLAGPYPAPNDAGLSDRCWGEPDLTDIAADVLPPDQVGRVRLAAGNPAAFTAGLRRGEVRCDYPPGGWTLEISFGPFGTQPGPDRMDLEPVAFEVPWKGAGPLRLLAPAESRYCGLAFDELLDQGEPEILPP